MSIDSPVPEGIKNPRAVVTGAITRRVDEREVTKRFVLGTVAVLIVVLTVFPLLFLAWTSVWSGYPGQFGASLTLDNFVSVYIHGSYDVYRLFSNSVFVALGMTMIAMTLGLLLAWLLVRTNLPTKGLMELVIISPYAVPGYIYAITYIYTYGPHGVITGLIPGATGLTVEPFNLYSPWGITVVVGIDAVTTFYLVTAPALQDMDPVFEEAGRVHGANIFATVRSITFPLIKPAISSAFILTLLIGLGEFAVVAMLGAPTGFEVFATAIWRSINLRTPPMYGEAAALAFSLLLVTMVLLLYHRKLTVRKEKFMTVTGRGYQPKTWDLGTWRWPIAAVLWVILSFIWIIPLLVMVVVSFHSAWSGHIDPAKITLVNYAEALSDDVIRRAFVNSLLVGAGGATIGTVLVVGLAYYTERTRYRFRNLVSYLAMTPLAIPGIIMGSSLIFTALWLGKLAPIVDIYGTLWIIIIGCVIVYLPVSSRIAIGNIVQIHTELEESARIFGASWFQQMREVFLPLFKNTTGVIWFYLMIHIFQAISVPIMTYTTGTEVVPVELFRIYYKEANVELVAALSTLFIGMTMMALIALRLAGITFYELDDR